MNISQIEEPLIKKIFIKKTKLIVHLKDGRIIHVPIKWYPKLANAKYEELKNFEIIGDGEGIHWPDLDEDLSVKGFLLGIKAPNKVKDVA